MGLRSHCGCADQSRPQSLRSSRRQCSSPARHRACSEAKPNHPMEGLHRLTHRCYHTHGLLYGRDPYLARTDHLYVLFAIQLETRRVVLAVFTGTLPKNGWNKVARNLTDSDPTLSVIRNISCTTGYEVLLALPIYSSGRRTTAAQTSCSFSQSECLCREMRPIRETGVPVEADPIR
jgi:hypothetical protein